jgi:hypothetical protein
MPAIAVVQYQVQPGKRADFIDAIKEAKQVAGRYGLSTRLLLSTLAGPNTGLYAMVWEAPDAVALATGLQGYAADAATPAIISRVDGLATRVSMSQATEVPL